LGSSLLGFDADAALKVPFNENYQNQRSRIFAGSRKLLR
jgi:hypothetical protein